VLKITKGVGRGGCSRDLRVSKVRNQTMILRRGTAHSQGLPGRAAGSTVKACSAALVECSVGAVVGLGTETSYGRAL